jgi:hypothetical protein
MFHACCVCQSDSGGCVCVDVCIASPATVEPSLCDACIPDISCVCECHYNCTGHACVCARVCECVCKSYRPVCVQKPVCLSVVCWNVCTLGGNKLCDPAFTATFSAADFVFLVETRVLPEKFLFRASRV